MRPTDNWPRRRGRSIAVWRVAAGLTACTALLALDAVVRPSPAPPAVARMVQHSTQPANSPLTRIAAGVIPMPADAPSAHASNLTDFGPGHPWRLLALWFAGSREAAPDVQIAASHLDRATGQWSPARYVLDRHWLASKAGFGFTRLGNPVGWIDAHGRLHAFVVATGLGGWAASRVVHVRQAEGSDLTREFRWDYVGVLPLSWVWNTSFLVRNAPLLLQDGGMVLPVHFELSRSLPYALRFDPYGGFLGMVRMSERTDIMQPSIVALGPDRWLAFLRNTAQERTVAVSASTDGGKHWAEQPTLALRNPDAAVAALSVAPGFVVMAHNPQPQGRNGLHISSSADGRNWLHLATPVHGDAAAEYSYPALAWADGSLWLSYTDMRRQIAWQQYSLGPGGQ